MPHVVTAVDASPPVEVVVVDYANDRPLGPLLPAQFKVPVYRGREHYHMAHARNIGVRQATGDVIVISSADLIPKPDFFELIRAKFAEGATWLAPPARRLRGVIAVPREELLKAGGFDERFEFYGPEDKELEARLRRRLGAPTIYMPAMTSIKTSKKRKFQNYSLSTRQEIHDWGKALLKTCNKEKAMVANEGVEWGSMRQP
jgi:GT2 family glycosyltransferase